jgi:ribosomal-protein-serine acetyltransferase
VNDPELLVDDDLALRPLSVDDADAYFAMVSRNIEHLTQHGDYEEMRSATLQSVRAELEAPADQHRYGIWYRGTLIGRVDLVPRGKGNFVLGYWLDGERTGHGFAAAACAALIAYGRDSLGATDFWAGVTKGNSASEKLLTRLGFDRVADLGSYDRFHRSA